MSAPARSSHDPLRIAYLVYRGNPHCGGQGVYTRELAKELTELGHQITVFSGPPYPDLVDPEHNVRYGTAYLRRLLDNLEHPELALAGYNAGGTRARRWWEGLTERDLPLFVESIPFDETRHYVKSVTWNRHFYGGPTAAASAP